MAEANHAHKLKKIVLIDWVTALAFEGPEGNS
jgi:hypothetical protein